MIIIIVNPKFLQSVSRFFFHQTKFRKMRSKNYADKLRFKKKGSVKLIVRFLIRWKLQASVDIFGEYLYKLVKTFLPSSSVRGLGVDTLRM